MKASPEIKEYVRTVTSKEDLEHGFTKNTAGIRHIICFLDEEFPGDTSLKIVELCSGIGIITTPVAAYCDVIVAVEKEQAFLDQHETYWLSHRQQIPCQHHFVCEDLTTWRPVSKRIKETIGRDWDVVVLNPPFHGALIRDCLDLAEDLDPKVVLAVVPLDVLEESRAGYSWRIAEDGILSVDQDRKRVNDFRNKGWKLHAIQPILRKDLTAQVGTLLFRKTQAG
jgi:hypothetical protein